MIYIKKRSRYSLSLLSGILLGISFPYSGSLFFLGFVAWIPLLLTEYQLNTATKTEQEPAHKRKNVFHILPHAYLTFLVYNLISTYWIYYASPEGAIFAFVLNSLLMALVIVAFHYTKRILGNKQGYMAFVFFWIGFEYIHYYWELSWPWINIGNIFGIVTPIVQWYTYTGILGGTLWLLIVNIVLFKIVLNVFIKRETWKIQTPLVYSCLLILVLPIGISLISFYTYKELKNPIEVVVTQPNIDPYGEKFTGSIEDQLNNIFEIAHNLVTPKTNFVLAPETALPFNFYEEDLKSMIYYHYLLNQKAKWNQASLLIGASTSKFFHTKNSRASRPVQEGAKYGFEENYNTSMLIDTKDKVSFIHKSKLVLGVEKIPFSNIFPWLETLAIQNGGTSGTLGIETLPPILKSEKTTFAPIVCYESIYGEFVSQQVRRGAEVLFVITNDGWWDNSPGHRQHLMFSKLRALETRRSLARSGNTGISCFIDQRGTIIKRTKYDERTGLRATINKNKVKTFYVTYGDVIGRVLGALGVLMFIFSIGQQFKQRFSFNK